MDGMAQFPDKYFELAIVDPPYGIGINHNIGRRKGDKPSDYKRVRWDDAPPDQAYFDELMRVSKNQIIWGGNYFRLEPSPCWLCWDKGFSSDVSFASFELAWTSFGAAAKRIEIPSAQNDRIHPTQKPVSLYRWLLQHYAKPGDKILDTHVGSASSLIACHEKGFQYVGFELDPDYYRSAKERLDKARDQVSIFDAQTKARAEQLTMIGGGSGA